MLDKKANSGNWNRLFIVWAIISTILALILFVAWQNNVSYINQLSNSYEKKCSEGLINECFNYGVDGIFRAGGTAFSCQVGESAKCISSNVDYIVCKPYEHAYCFSNDEVAMINHGSPMDCSPGETAICK